MKKTKIYDFYAFGFNYSLMTNVYMKGWKRDKATQLLSNFFKNLNDIDTPVSLKVAERLKKILDEMKASTDAEISEEMAKRIETEIDKIDPSLDAELQLKEAFILTEKRFPLKSLTSDPQKLLGENVFSTLSPNSQKDFSLACMQIALAQPTSSAFHLMRALEEEVKKLYFSFKKTNRLNNPMWGPMIKELRTKKAPKPSTKAIDHLDSIRIHFRNPTQHPEAFYTLDEAQDLLNQTITAINMICREIAAK